MEMTDFRQVAEGARERLIAELNRVAESVESPIRRQTPLDVLDSARDSITGMPLDPGPRRRRFQPAPSEPQAAERRIEVTDGVRVFVEQLRIAGQDELAIARHLEQIGVENPASVVSEILNPEGSVAAES